MDLLTAWFTDCDDTMKRGVFCPQFGEVANVGQQAKMPPPSLDIIYATIRNVRLLLLRLSNISRAYFDDAASDSGASDYVDLSASRWAPWPARYREVLVPCLRRGAHFLSCAGIRELHLTVVCNI